MDEKSLNVSRFPKTAGKGCYVDSINEKCPCGVVDTSRQCAYNLDLWVRSPVEDVLPELRDDVANHGKYRIAGLDDGVTDEQKQNRYAFRRSMVNIQRSACGEIILRAPEEALPLRLEMFALDGRLVCKKMIVAKFCRISRHSISNAATMVRIRYKRNRSALTKLIPAGGF
jgi:hypothetical protein